MDKLIDTIERDIGKQAARRNVQDHRLLPNLQWVAKRLLQNLHQVLAVSQFTLAASTKKGNRPSYIHAAGHELAVPLYERYCKQVEALLGHPVAKGQFGADMQVELINDGPVTIIVDSKNKV